MIVRPSLFKGMGGYKTRANSSASQYVASELSPSYFHGFPSVHLVDASISLLRCPKLFPTVSPPSTLSSLQSRSFPTELSPSYFPRFPLLPPCRRFHLAPSQRSSYFPRLPVHPCRRFRIPPSPRGSPQAISHGFPSVHLVLAPSQRSSPQAISHGSPSTLSWLQSHSFPTELSPSYFPRFPLRPPSRRFRIAPQAAKSTKREHKHRRCFWEKHLKISKDKCQEMTSK